MNTLKIRNSFETSFIVKNFQRLRSEVGSWQANRYQLLKSVYSILLLHILNASFYNLYYHRNTIGPIK